MPRGVLEVVKSWMRVRGRSLDHLSFAARRIAGLILVGYLFIHMVDISVLLLGEEAYNALTRVFTSGVGLVLDVFLWIMLVLHGSLGLYSIVVELGIWVERRRLLLLSSWAVIVSLSLLGAWIILNVLG